MLYNECTFKGTHNSFEVRWGMRLSEQLDWHRERARARAVRGVELDLVQMSRGGGFYVSHSRREAGNRVEWYLDDLRRWSEANPGHEVVTVVLDLKSVIEPASLADEVDGVIRDSGLAIVRPAEVMRGRHATLLEALVAEGWPEVTSMAGRFLFVTTGGRPYEYIGSGAADPELLAFSSHDWRSMAPSGAAVMNESPWGVFVNVGPWDRQRQAMLSARRGLLAPHLVLRTWGGRTESDWRRAVQLGVTLVAVDVMGVG